MKKRLFSCGKILCIVLFVLLIAATAVSCGKNVPASEEYSSVNFAVTDATPIYGEVTNLVVFICFSDEETDLVSDGVTESVVDVFMGEDDSLYDYYYDLSFGRISVRSLFPDGEGRYFVYRAPNKRSYYASIKNGSKNRTSVESKLLNDAIRAVDPHFLYEDKDLDVNRDGYVDSVTFLVSGGYDPSDGNAWGGLLWPHSWELKKITSSGAPSALNGVTVNRYSFNFLETINPGVVCHETGHVLGMPDLYHYDYDTGYLQVGEWDLMHAFTDTPQYTLTYLRARYLGVVPDSAVVDLKAGGTYSLKPTTLATDSDILAYRIVISDVESIWMEYRNNAVSTYDGELSGSGLIVYRVNNSVRGNENGRNHSTYSPDEVYIYRPNVAGTGTRAKENTNLSYAALSPDNEKFSTLGGRNYSGKYNQNAIYLTNGVNTGISVTADDVNEERVVFTVDVNGFGTKEVSDMYVEGAPSINYGEDLSIRVKLRVKGSSEYVTADPKNYVVEYDPTLIGTQIATVVYHDEDNEDGVQCTFKLVIKDAVAVDGVAIATLPDRLEYAIGERVDLTGLSINVRYLSTKPNEDPITVTYQPTGVANWSIEGVDEKRSGEYYAKVTYLPFDVYVYVKITVRSELSSVRISERNTTTAIDPTVGSMVNVLGVNADGSTRLLFATEYDLSLPADGTTYVAREMRITATEKPLSATKTVYYVKSGDLTGIELTALPDKTIYRYGESLDLAGGEITMTFGDFSVAVPAENYFYLFDGGFSPTTRGRQTLLAEVFGKSVSLTVTVLPPDGTFLNPSSDDATVGNNFVLFKNPTSIARAERSFSSYLTVRFIYTDKNLPYEINSVTHSIDLDRNVSVELLNADGRIIAKYRVYVFGDADNDGKTDENDLDGWANALFTNVSGADIYLDADGDGKYTLTDFSILVDRYGGRV